MGEYSSQRMELILVGHQYRLIFACVLDGVMANVAGGEVGAPIAGVSGQLFGVAAVTSGGQIKANFGPEFAFNLESLEGDSRVQQGIPN